LDSLRVCISLRLRFGITILSIAGAKCGSMSVKIRFMRWLADIHRNATPGQAAIDFEDVRVQRFISDFERLMRTCDHGMSLRLPQSLRHLDNRNRKDNDWEDDD
jgi:hypothetical protein